MNPQPIGLKKWLDKPSTQSKNKMRKLQERNLLRAYDNAVKNNHIQPSHAKITKREIIKDFKAMK